MTELEQRALEAVAAVYRETGYPATVRDVSERMGMKSSASAFRHLHSLERQGKVRQRGRQGFMVVKRRRV